MFKYIINKIKFIYWWHFQATEQDKMLCDLLIHGRVIAKMHDQIKENATRINPVNFFKDPKDE